MRYLVVADLLRIHRRVIEAIGGDPTVLDMGGLESAVAQPRMTFDGESLYPTLHEKAAALAYSLSKNHSFQDGNKRTSHADQSRSVGNVPAGERARDRRAGR